MFAMISDSHGRSVLSVVRLVFSSHMNDTISKDYGAMVE